MKYVLITAGRLVAQNDEVAFARAREGHGKAVAAERLLRNVGARVIFATTRDSQDSDDGVTSVPWQWHVVCMISSPQWPNVVCMTPPVRGKYLAIAVSDLMIDGISGGGAGYDVRAGIAYAARGFTRSCSASI
jgi:hypothetical protein